MKNGLCFIVLKLLVLMFIPITCSEILNSVPSAPVNKKIKKRIWKSKTFWTGVAVGVGGMYGVRSCWDGWYRWMSMVPRSADATKANIPAPEEVKQEAVKNNESHQETLSGKDQESRHATFVSGWTNELVLLFEQVDPKFQDSPNFLHNRTDQTFFEKRQRVIDYVNHIEQDSSLKERWSEVVSIKKKNQMGQMEEVYAFSLVEFIQNILKQYRIQRAPKPLY